MMHLTLLSIELLELWREYTFTILEGLQGNRHVLYAGEGFANEFLAIHQSFPLYNSYFWLFI